MKGNDDWRGGTGCYLGSEANRIPALPLSAVLAQLDALRRHLGPKEEFYAQIQ